MEILRVCKTQIASRVKDLGAQVVFSLVLPDEGYGLGRERRILGGNNRLDGVIGESLGFWTMAYTFQMKIFYQRWFAPHKGRRKCVQ